MCTVCETIQISDKAAFYGDNLCKVLSGQKGEQIMD